MAPGDLISTYRVRDFWLAATLVALGMPILRVEVQPRRPGERPGPPWAVFVLKDCPDRAQMVADYHADRMLISPAKLRTAFRLCQQMRSAASGDDRGEEA